MRKKCLAVLLVIVMSMSVAACGSGNDEGGGVSTDVEDSGETEMSEKEKSTGEVETLSLLMYTDWYKDGWKALESYIDENAEELGFKLEISTIQGGDQGDQIIATKFASDDLPDLIQVYKPLWMEARCGGNDKLVDLSDISSVSEYDDAVLQATYYYDGKLCGMPIDTVTYANAVFYNKEVFEQYNIEEPQTWDEFIKVCDFFKNETDMIPLFYSGSDVWTLQMNACTSLFNDVAEKGQGIADLMGDINTNKVKYSDNQQLIDAIERSKQLITDGYVQESYMSDTFDNAQEAIVDKTAAMFINGTWFTDNISAKYPESIDNIGVFVLPSGTGENYVDMYVPYTLCVTTGAKDIDTAKKAVEWITSAEAQQIYADAQPGIYLNKNVTSGLTPAVQELKDIADSGMVMANWLESNLYSFGNFGVYLADYYTGNYTEAIQITQEMDDETERNAQAAGDENWK